MPETKIDISQLDVSQISEIAKQAGGLFIPNSEALQEYEKTKEAIVASNITKRNEEFVRETIKKITGKEIVGEGWTKSYPRILEEYHKENEELKQQVEKFKSSSSDEVLKQQVEKIKANSQKKEIEFAAKEQEYAKQIEEISTAAMNRSINIALDIQAKSAYLPLRKELEVYINQLKAKEKSASPAEKPAVTASLVQAERLLDFSKMTLNQTLAELKSNYTFAINEDNDLEVLEKETGAKVKKDDAYSDFNVGEFVFKKIKDVLDTFNINVNPNIGTSFSSAPTKSGQANTRLSFEDKVNLLTIPDGMNPQKDIELILAEWAKKTNITKNDVRFKELRKRFQMITQK